MKLLDRILDGASGVIDRLRHRGYGSAKGEMRMMFLDNLKVPVRFADAKLVAQNPEKRKARYTFALDLDDKTKDRLPRPIQEAYEAMNIPGGGGRVDRLPPVEGRTVELRLAPDFASPQLIARAVEINRLRLEKVSSKATRSLITLFFSFELTFEEGFAFSRYVGDTIFFSNYATQKELPLK